jgi:hypothetical protein
MSDVPDAELVSLVDQEARVAILARGVNHEHLTMGEPILSEAIHWMVAEKPNERDPALLSIVGDVMNTHCFWAIHCGDRYLFAGHNNAHGTVIGIIRMQLYRPFSTQCQIQSRHCNPSGTRTSRGIRLWLHNVSYTMSRVHRRRFATSQSDCFALKTNWILSGDGWTSDTGPADSITCMRLAKS